MKKAHDTGQKEAQFDKFIKELSTPGADIGKVMNKYIGKEKMKAAQAQIVTI